MSLRVVFRRGRGRDSRVEEARAPARQQWHEAVKRVAAKGIQVVMTNRGGVGRVTDTRASESRPLIWGDDLDRAEIQRIFQTY